MATPGGSSLPVGRLHLDALRRALDGLEVDVATVNRWGAELGPRLTSGARLLAVGNGGSAAQAQHLTSELVGRYRDDRRPFSALCLHGDTSSVTAIVNDYGADEVFARQVSAHGRTGDVLVALSTSGRSPNVLAAAQCARSLGLGVWALTGRAPNPLSEIADETVAVDAPFTATVQEVHQVVVHLLCAALDVAVGVSTPLLEPADRSGRDSGDGEVVA
jgi:D-sedoheptulose 7-phosphate isomerase